MFKMLVPTGAATASIVLLLAGCDKMWSTEPPPTSEYRGGILDAARQLNAVEAPAPEASVAAKNK